MADDRCKTQAECPHAGQCEIEGRCVRAEGSRLLQVAVAPDAAAGPYPTAMRPATSADILALRAPVPSTLDEWGEFVAWVSSRGYDLNDRAIKHDAWFAWQERARRATAGVDSPDGRKHG